MSKIIDGFRNMETLKLMVRFGSVWVIFLLLSYGQITKDVPLMEYLPNGTTLTNVTIPSYDDKREPTSIFEAVEVTIVDKDVGIMDAKKVRLKVLAGDAPYSVELQKARYYYQKSYLEAEQHTMIHNDSLTISGTGACYDLSSRELFIKGPSKAIMTSKDVAKNITTAVLSAVAILPLSAEPPTPPSDQQLSLVEEVRTESHSAERERQVKQEEAIIQINEKKQESEEKLSTFLVKTGQEDLLVKNEEEKEEKTTLVAPDGALIINCDDGMYYDTEEGLMVCLKNVELEEPRFNLKCTKQLKIFLSSKSDDQAEENMGFGSSDLKELIATGDTVLVYKDTGNQPPVTLTGESAYIDAQTEEITMSGGLPTMRQGQNFVEALEPTWIKISRKGVRFGPGKKRTVYLPEDE